MPQVEAIASKSRSNQTTRERLILATERLVARHGVEGVSMRQIVQTAGLANNSGVQYHFGSKEGLIGAVLAYRQPEIDARRSELLDMVRARGNPSIRDVLVMLLRPLSEMVNENGEHVYAQFIWQLQRPDQSNQLSFRLPTLAERSDEVPRMLRERLGGLSAPFMDRLIRGAVEMFLFLLVSRDNQPERSGDLSLEDELQITVDMIEAAIAAATRAAMKRRAGEGPSGDRDTA